MSQKTVFEALTCHGKKSECAVLNGSVRKDSAILADIDAHGEVAISNRQ